MRRRAAGARPRAHSNNAQLFMNYILRPEVHAAQTNKGHHTNGIAFSAPSP